MQRRMFRLIGQIIEDPDEIRQQLHIAGAVMEAAGKAEFARAVPGHFADGHHHVPCAIPRAALLGVEAVSAGAGIGEGSIDVTGLFGALPQDLPVSIEIVNLERSQPIGDKAWAALCLNATRKALGDA